LQIQNQQCRNEVLELFFEATHWLAYNCGAFSSIGSDCAAWNNNCVFANRLSLPQQRHNPSTVDPIDQRVQALASKKEIREICYE
jgi:hypothetical protein